MTIPRLRKRRPIARTRHWVAEQLESRKLLTGTLFANDSFTFSPTVPGDWPKPLPQGYTVTISGSLNGASITGAATGPFASKVAP